ncbi:acylneuraminate cytidylyltransferase family protein [Wenyingzhuangia sp. chi5]|uniref:Acylneuraminate cytidylyltransferase family protein n=1 Tax=Wenyingzhuangia gilva TaxID=3057677 RepID=A0ABT8VT40_9FLAO|nr:acylneuraminate cytidylyltransferase family protein [Wenyingzhuangia sp. chi5]MDO3695127.1 acylneuraminate cytidylyltransferase family protein [Wenyingzhuangia sp. chi5]
MKVLGIIPARGGSKGVPRKNIKLLGGKPLIQYTSEVALASKWIDTVVLSSDDDEIIEVSKKIGIVVPFKRPSDLAIDTTPTLPVIQHALTYYKSIGVDFDAVCLLQVTSPFRTVDFLNKAIEKFIKADTDSLVSVQEVPHEYNPHWVFEESSNGNLKIATGDEQIISRRQDLPKAYHRDGSIYITKTSVLLEQDSLYGNSVAYIESPKEWYVNIDTMEDWAKAEELFKKIKN